MIESSELILHSDGSIFHLRLKPEEVAPTVILVGDPGRVSLVSSFFDEVTVRRQNREFYTHTGTYNNVPVSVISTGIGIGNVDIVMNELDALFNIDLESREVKKKLTTLRVVRLGTCGGLQPETPEGTFVASNISIGFDGLLNYYGNRESIALSDAEEQFIEHTQWSDCLPKPYFVKAAESLIRAFEPHAYPGITVSAPGFYAPQGRVLRLPLACPDLNKQISTFVYKGHKITNLEMESSAVTGLANLLGHQSITVCVVIANRYAHKVNVDYRQRMEDLIQMALCVLTQK